MLRSRRRKQEAQEPARTSRELDLISDARVADFLGVAIPGTVIAQPEADDVPAPVVAHPAGQMVAGHANRRGTTLVIDRPRDVWPWLDRGRRGREEREPRQRGTVLLFVASFLVLLLASGQGYVSWFAQFRFVEAAKHAVLPSGIEALGLDTGAVIFALLGLALVRLQRRAIVPRVLNVSCAAGSLAMNVLGADLHSIRSIVIYALPSALYATASDQLIAVVRRHALPADVDAEEQKSAWAMAWRAIVRALRVVTVIGLYILRLLFALPSTVTGLRLLLLNLTPLPEVAPVPARPPAGGGGGRGGKKNKRGRGPSKKSVLLALYAADPAFGDRTKASPTAAALAERAGLTAGAARTYIYRLLNSTPANELRALREQLLAEGNDPA